MISVLLADGHRMFRQGLIRVLASATRRAGAPSGGAMVTRLSVLEPKEPRPEPGMTIRARILLVGDHRVAAR